MRKGSNSIVRKNIRQSARSLAVLSSMLCAIGPFNVLAQSHDSLKVTTLRDAITRTVLNNPEVNSRWHSFEAAREEQRVVEGNYRPDLDLEATIAWEESRTPTRAEQDYVYDQARVRLTQMLFDGWETSKEVERMDYIKLTRFYELKEISEASALEATQAYIDLLRFRSLLELTKANYIEHRLMYRNIQEKVSAGISRGVDLEQAKGRLALAESNLLTEITNLHDVTARFQRLVGALPADIIERPLFDTSVIANSREAVVEQAHLLHPSVNAAIEAIRAARAEMETHNSEFYPRVDLRLSKEIGHNASGIDGESEKSTAEILFQYNLYNGGADKARKRQFYQRMHKAKEDRLKICQDVRQTVLIAYNDVSSLEEQLVYLSRNVASIGKARSAYREQFNIGQRTLLDLLDTENEYFEVRRALVNAKHDYSLAEARTLGGVGVLLDALSVGSLAEKALPNVRLDRNENDPLWSERCPTEVTQTVAIDKEALLAQVLSDDRLTGFDLSLVDERAQLVTNVDLDELLVLESGEPTQSFAAPEPEIVTAPEGEIDVRLNVEFAYKSTALSNASLVEIEKAASFLKNNPDVTAVLEGHTDSKANDAYNLKLSQQRADAVKAAMVQHFDVPSAQVKAVGYGEAYPVSSNNTDEGRARNRRVQLVLGNVSPEAAATFKNGKLPEVVDSIVVPDDDEDLPEEWVPQKSVADVEYVEEVAALDDASNNVTSNSAQKIVDVDLPANLKFEYKSTKLTDQSTHVVSKVAAFLLANPDQTLSIEGHTDSAAKYSYNIKLSLQRADSVKAIFMDKFGVPAKQLQAIGWGEEKPIASNDTEQGRAKNRRVELNLVDPAASADDVITDVDAFQTVYN